MDKQIVPPDGPVPCDLVICGEAPGRVELEEGRGFVGPAGRILWGGYYNLIPNILNRNRDNCYVTNVTKTECSDGQWKQISPEEQQQQYEQIRSEIKNVRPLVVLAFGRRACMALVPNFYSIKADHGKARRGYDDYWVVPLWHPAAALRGNSLVIPLLKEALAMVPALLDPMGRFTHTDQFLEVGAWDPVARQEGFDAVASDAVRSGHIVVQSQQSVAVSGMLFGDDPEPAVGVRGVIKKDDTA